MLLLALATPLVLLGTLLGMHAVERWLEGATADPVPAVADRAPAAGAVVTLPRQTSSADSADSAQEREVGRSLTA